MKDLHHHRQHYGKSELLEGQLPGDPFTLFHDWFENAGESGIREPNAMALSTVSPEGMPASRMVLLKAFSEEGFIFYTNYLSRKGRDLEFNPSASLLFYWDVCERQIRIEGKTEPIPFHLSDAYFSSRPWESRLSAAVSEQSAEISSREELEQKLETLRKQESIKRPEHWGGYLLIPEYFEFWQGRPNRLHDRIYYRRNQEGWKRGRLSP